MSEQIMVTNVRGDQVPLAHDFGLQAQEAAEEHINNVWGYYHAEEEGTQEGDSPSVGAFDGCTTCEVREILFASLPFLQAGFARDGEAPAETYAINLIQCPNEQEILDGEVVDGNA